MTYVLLLLLPLHLLASPWDLAEEEINPESEEILLKKPEKHLQHESMVYDFNSELGIKDQRRYTGTDSNRFAVAGHINGRYEQLQDLFGVEAVYMRRSTRYNRFWYGAQFLYVNSKFGNLSENATSTGVNSEGNFRRPRDAKNNLSAFGLGVGYRFKLLLDFYPTEDVFENVDVFANAVQFDESFIGQKYRGYGLTTNYGLHKRSSNDFYYGAKLGYNIAFVTRDAFATEGRKARSLTLGWYSLAFEMGFFY
jgi:hypothetical protein